MLTDVGEYIVGAYLKIELKCDFVDYNVRPPGGGIAGLGELDVIGLDFTNEIAYLCEVTTHIRGILYKSNKDTVVKIKDKHKRQKVYAAKYLKNFKEIKYMLWSPVVPKGYITENLEKITTLESVINKKYTDRINKLRERAKKETHDAGNPFFRMLQIIEHLR